MGLLEVVLVFATWVILAAAAVVQYIVSGRETQ